ncbi:MAG: peptide chain release factor N(5)-glutamine methyltransferase [Bacteroidetes bacterium]|nr:MAG: peptide chain release factor N(5)-glutamine methyltransferase [Bacteroidota bacterium]
MILKSLKNSFSTALLEHYPETEIDSFFNLLSEHVLKMKRIDISQNLYSLVSGKKYDKFDNAIIRLKDYEPIQYIIGDTEFYSLTFNVTPSVLIPRSETEELVDWIINEQKDKDQISILDIGTGSGCIAISLAKNLPNAKVYALDVSEEALKVAEQNALLNEVEVEFIEANILDWNFSNLEFDVIVSNPPYVRELEKEAMSANVLNHEPHLALFVEDEDALLFYRKITESAKRGLKSKGDLYFEINEVLGKDMSQLLSDSGYSNIELKKDIFQKDRMIKANKL